MNEQLQHLQISLDLRLMREAVVPMDGFCECPHDVPPMLANLRGMRELLQNNGGHPKNLNALEFGYMVDVFWNTVQSPVVALKVLPMIEVESSTVTHTPELEVPFDVFMNLLVHEYMSSQYLPKVAPHLVAKIDPKNYRNLDYLCELDFNYLEFIDRWIEADQIPVVEMAVFFTTLWVQNAEVAQPLTAKLMQHFKGESVPEIDEIHAFGLQMIHKYSEQAYTPKSQHGFVTDFPVFEATAIN